MNQLLTIKLLIAVALLLSSVAGYTTYRWRQEVAHEKRVEDFWKQAEQKRKQDKAVLDGFDNWGDALKKRHIN